MDYEKTAGNKKPLSGFITEMTLPIGGVLVTILVQFEHFSNDKAVKL